MGLLFGCSGVKALVLRIDNDPEVIQKAQDEGFISLKGDATQDKVLIEAGIKRAKGVVCVLPSDAENLYVILTAKELNQKMSVFELYLCLNYAYNRYNDYVKFTELNSFLSTEYGINSSTYSTNPFTGVYPFKYEKLVNCCQNQELEIF